MSSQMTHHLKMTAGQEQNISHLFTMYLYVFNTLKIIGENNKLTKYTALFLNFKSKDFSRYKKIIV